MTLERIAKVLGRCKIAYKRKDNGIEADKVLNNEHKPVSMSFGIITYKDYRGTCISYMIEKMYGNYEGQGCWFDDNDTEDTLLRLLKKYGFDIPKQSFTQMRLF